MNNNLAKLLGIVNNQRSSAGFTLIELLIAASLTTVVTGLAGSGMVAMTENNKKAQAETERRVELNRALDFISDEARQAKFVAKNASATLGIVAPTFTRTGKTPVLTLQIPNVPERVIYYIAPKPAGSPWLGPNIIYRWGPNLNAEGKYNPATLNNPASWTDEPLADLIEDSTPSVNTNCSAGWSATPAVASRQGFYACVDPDGRIAETHLRGRLRGAYGNSRPSFDVTTKAFARSFELAAAQSAAALAAAETAAIELAAAQAAANTAATNAATAVTNLGTLQTAANNAATALATATTALTTAQTTATNTPTAANYTALAAAERAVTEAITNARNTATATSARQIEVDRTADLNATAQAAALAAATTAQAAAASAGQGSTEQAATDYANRVLTNANTAVSTYTTAAQTAATAATAAQAAVNQNAATLITATVAAATTHTNAATAADAAAVRATTNSVFTTSNGVITFTKQATGSFKVIGGDSGGIPVTTNVYKNGSTTNGTLVVKPATGQTPQIATVIGSAGTTLTVTGRADSFSYGGVSYGGFNANSNTNRDTQVWTLRNGDPLPPFTPYPGQEPPATYLTAAGLLVNGKIRLADNQVIYLFEVTTTNRTRTDYDIQDIIVLATIT